MAKEHNANAHTTAEPLLQMSAASEITAVTIRQLCCTVYCTAALHSRMAAESKYVPW
jgi:hypothetical protein